MLCFSKKKKKKKNCDNNIILVPIMTTIIITSFPTPNRAPAGKFVQISSQHVPLRAQHQRGAPQQGRTGQAEGFDVALPVEGMVSTCLCIYIYITIYYILLYIIYYYILYITIYYILLPYYVLPYILYWQLPI